MRRVKARWCWTTGVGRVGAAVALVAVVAAAGQADAATLRWKFKEGEALHYQMDQTTTTTIVLKANNQEIKTTNNQVIDLTWKVGKVAADGTAEITQTIDRMRSKVESAFGSFDYDSKSDKVPEGPIAASVVPTLKLLVGASFQYKMGPRGELTDVRVPEGLLKSLKEASPASAAAAGSIFTEDGLKNMIHESSLALPEEDLAPGKSWSRATKLPPSPVGTMSLDKTYTYTGPADGKEKLDVKVAIKLEPPANATVDIKIAEQEGSGSFLFDNTAGRVVESNVVQKIKMAINVQNQQIEQTTETKSVMMSVPGPTS